MRKIIGFIYDLVVGLLIVAAVLAFAFGGGGSLGV